MPIVAIVSRSLSESDLLLVRSGEFCSIWLIGNHQNHNYWQLIDCLIDMSASNNIRINPNINLSIREIQEIENGINESDDDVVIKYL